VFRFWHDNTGSVLVAYTLLLPLFLLVTLGAVDAAYVLYEDDLANKAAYVGARTAAISDPVAQLITAPATLNYTAANSGQACYNFVTGAAAKDANGNPICPSITSVTCTSTGCSPNTYGFDSTAFTNIFNAMQKIFPRLQARHVTISYEGNGSGFSGRPNGLPMDITVQITGMSHQFFFIPRLLPFFGIVFPAALSIPSYSSTMQSEDMVTN
jgi:TadE-like protein